MPTTVRDIVQYASVPTPAAELLALLHPFGPAVEDGALVFDIDPPAELLPALRALHTGVRAALTGRQWWGSSAAGAKRPRVEALSIHEPIPDWCGLLSVESDQRWDRIRPTARLELPHLFAVATEPHGKRNRRGARR